MAEEKKEKEKPVIEFSLGIGGLFKELGEFIEQVAKLSEEAEVVEKAGVPIEHRRLPSGMYGVSVKIGPAGPVLRRFGTIKPTLKPGVAEVREPLVDIFENGKEITVIAEIPGVEEKDIKIEVEGRVLKISGEGKDRKYSKDVDLPAPVTGELEKTYKNGVLEIKFKKLGE